MPFYNLLLVAVFFGGFFLFLQHLTVQLVAALDPFYVGQLFYLGYKWPAGCSRRSTSSAEAETHRQ